MNHRPVSALLAAAALSAAAFTRLSAADQKPQPVFQPAPSYAFDLRKSQTEGEVLVSFTISAQGDVLDAVAVHFTQRLFVEPTLAAVRKWKFKPAMSEGRPVRTVARQLVAFVVPEREAERNAALAATAGKAAGPSVKNLASNR